MLQIEVLRRKPVININNENIIDLTTKAFDFTGAVSVYNTMVVTDDFVMRSDLVAKVYYGNSNRIDFLLKFNGISNPFSLDVGQILMIGDENELKSQLANQSNAPDNQAKKDIRSAFFDPNRLSKKDQSRLSYIQKKSQTQTAGSTSNLPPNFAEPGSKELTVQDGKVIFGNDVVGNKANCPDPLSRARVKAKLLENKIFK